MGAESSGSWGHTVGPKSSKHQRFSNAPIRRIGRQCCLTTRPLPPCTEESRPSPFSNANRILPKENRTQERIWVRLPGLAPAKNHAVQQNLKLQALFCDTHRRVESPKNYTRYSSRLHQPSKRGLRHPLLPRRRTRRPHTRRHNRLERSPARAQSRHLHPERRRDVDPTRTWNNLHQKYP